MSERIMIAVTILVATLATCCVFGPLRPTGAPHGSHPQVVSHAR